MTRTAISQLLSPHTLPPDVNHLRLQWCAESAVQSGDVVAVAVGLPEVTFRSMLQRAARHPGYSSRGAVHTVRRVRGLELTDAGRGEVKVKSRDVRRVLQLPGAPLLAILSDEFTVPLAAFPCDAELHRVCQVRQVCLRAHKRAQLVFEVGVDKQGPPAPPTYTVRIDVDLSGPRHALTRDLSDLARTVENTVHVVLMGAPPLRERAATVTTLPRRT